MDIKLCETCKGSGKREEHGFRDSTFVTCENCNGTGKVLENVYHFKVQIPWSDERENVNKLYEIDNKLWTCYRECVASLKTP
ncbi:MAG: hypothetical protein WC979_02870 [Candidatus Pacearchaeota archaeon]|jgi:hypothetical protein|nr:zinc finger-like domain-containing protein [Clostridia bacterium]